MILFMILLFTLVFLVLFGIFALSLGGAAVIIVFGDVIVCAFLIAWIIKLIIRKKKRGH